MFPFNDFAWTLLTWIFDLLRDDGALQFFIRFLGVLGLIAGNMLFVGTFIFVCVDVYKTHHEKKDPLEITSKLQLLEIAIATSLFLFLLGGLPLLLFIGPIMCISILGHFVYRATKFSVQLVYEYQIAPNLKQKEKGPLIKETR